MGIEREGLLVARSLIEPRKGQVIVRLYNPGSEEVTLRKDVTRATAELVQEVDRSPKHCKGRLPLVARVTKGQMVSQNYQSILKNYSKEAYST